MAKQWSGSWEGLLIRRSGGMSHRDRGHGPWFQMSHSVAANVSRIRRSGERGRRGSVKVAGGLASNLAPPTRGACIMHACRTCRYETSRTKSTRLSSAELSRQVSLSSNSLQLSSP